MTLFTKAGRAVLLTGLLALTLAGCGTRGRLEAPAATQDGATPPAADATRANPQGPDRPFILDVLI